MSNRRTIVGLLNSYMVEDSQINEKVFKIIEKLDYPAFCQLGLVGKSKLEPLWNQIINIKSYQGEGKHAHQKSQTLIRRPKSNDKYNGQPRKIYHLDKDTKPEKHFRVESSNNFSKKQYQQKHKHENRHAQKYFEEKPKKQQRRAQQIFARLPIKNKNQAKDHQIRAVIYGPCGNGKTTTINNICGTNYQTGESIYTLTRQITESQSRIRYHPRFKIIDTPGTTSSVDKLRHAAFLKNSLTWKPLNAVFVLVKVEPRYDQFLLELLFQAQIMKGHLQKVVFLVSHLDASNNPQVLMQTVNSLLTEKKIESQVVFYSNLQCDKDQLSNIMYEIAKNMPQTKIKISNEHFLRYFNLKRNEKESLLFDRQQKELIDEMAEISQQYISCAKQIPESKQKPDIIQDLAIHMKSELSKMFNKYTYENKESMAGLDYYITYYTLQTKIADLCQQFQKETRVWRKQEFGNYGYSGDTTPNIRDLIKKCPNCDLIWYRIDSCPNTTCGNRPNSIFDFFKSVIFKYYIVRKNGKVQITGKRKLENRNQENLEKKSNKKVTQQTKIGCGASMRFDQLPRLENIEEILTELVAVETMQTVIDKVKNNQKMMKIQKNAEREVQNKVRAVLK